MKAPLVDTKGKKVKDITLNESVFGVEVKPEILAQYEFAYSSNQRQANAHSKDRSEVRGGGRKPWRQKGTGRARFGSSRNPIWTGGGVAFGPTNNRNFKKKLTKKFKKAAMRHALSFALQNEKIVIVESADIDSKKSLTAGAEEFGTKLNIGNAYTLVTGEHNKERVKAFNNVSGSQIVFVNDMNVHDILSASTVVLDTDAVKKLEGKLKVEKKK